MPMLFASDRCQSALVSACSYQRIEKPCNGYEKYEPELNESGMIARIGAIRKNSTSAVWKRTQRAAMRSVSTLLRWSCMSFLRRIRIVQPKRSRSIPTIRLNRK